MKKKINKIYKIKQIKELKTNNNIYIFRYNNISNKNIILIKKKLNKLKIKSLVIKKNLINKKLNFKLNINGCLFIIYNNNNNYINLIKNFIFFKKINFLIFINNNNFYSIIKIKNIFLKFNKMLNFNLITPFIFFNKILKKI